MNIKSAIHQLELHGGHIYRDDSDPVKICRWVDDSWTNFEGCRVTLTIRDLVSIDWKHSSATE